jgi:hypothetical protein
MCGLTPGSKRLATPTYTSIKKLHHKKLKKTKNRMKTINSLLGAILLSACVAIMLAATIGVDAQDAMQGILALSFGVGIIGAARGGRKQNGLATAGLFKEVWLGDLLGKFWDKNDYLQDGKDLTPFVEADKINLAEIGVSPNVVKNRSSYPIPVTQRTDTALQLQLDDYSSDSTLVRDVEAISLSYDKRQSIINDHKDSIYAKVADDGIYNIAPTTNTTFTPVIKTTGAVSAIHGQKMLVSDDIANMARALDLAKYPAEGRVMVVHPNAFWEFVNADAVLKEQASKNGNGGTATGTWVYYMGFMIKSRVTTAWYNKTTLTKLAYGAVPGAGDSQASLVYFDKGRSFGRGLGSNEMYAKLKDPDNQGDIINFRQRAVVLPFRQKLIAAIIGG